MKAALVLLLLASPAFAQDKVTDTAVAPGCGADDSKYDVTTDKNGEVWSGGEYSDRVLRLQPKSGSITEYLLPRFTNIRRVFVDNSTTPVTFWVGNNHGASIIKLEPLD